MLGDKAYDSAELRVWLQDRGTKPVIPNRSNRKQPFSFNRRLYKERRRIENAFSRLKDQAHCYSIRPAGAKLPRLCLSRRRSCMADLMGPDPSKYI
jgi:transposase